jgi:hypothetical protein
MAAKSKAKSDGASEDALEEAMQAFSTDEPFKKVASRLEFSPNTLRRLWKERFGEDAFTRRGIRLQAKGAIEFGARKRGIPKKKNWGTTHCSRCNGLLQVTKAEQAARMRHGSTFLCNSCLGRDIVCPVCGLQCQGRKGLSTHIYQRIDPKHHEYVSQLGNQRWANREEGRDYVSCSICGLKSPALNRHLSTHGLTVREYRAKFPGCKVQADSWIQAKAENAIQFRYNLTKGDLLSCADSDGRVIVALVCARFNCVGSTVIGYCRKYEIPTRNKLAWQKLVLDQAKAHLGSDYIWEWSIPEITNPETGRALNFDGYFPEHRLIIEAHGDQHFRYSEKWHGSAKEFQNQHDRDGFKRTRAEELGYRVKVVRPTDPIMSSDFWSSFLDDDPRYWENASILDRGKRVRDVVRRVREEGWPLVIPSSHAQAELSHLKKLNVFLDDLRHIRPYSIRGTMVCGSFFPNRYHARYKGSLSVFDAWKDDNELRKAVTLQLNSGHPTTAARILKALILFHRTPSVFRPAIAKYIYQSYAPNGVVWDPCSGYGGRLMGAMAAGVRTYIGTDSEPETVAGNCKLAKALGVESQCSINLARAEEFDPGKNIDLVFTSPPYYDLEFYGAASDSRAYGDVDAWIQEFLRKLVVSSYQSLRLGGHLILNLPFTPVQERRLDRVARVLAADIGFEEAPILWMPVRSFRGDNKAEPVLVFRKV